MCHHIFSYYRCLQGLPPEKFKGYMEAEEVEDELKATIKICLSMHMVLLPIKSGGIPLIQSELNRADLSCTCKGFRLKGLCSHVVAVTVAWGLDEEFGMDELDSYLRHVSDRRMRSHRPKQARRGNQIQGDTDTQEQAPCPYCDEDLECI